MRSSQVLTVALASYGSFYQYATLRRPQHSRRNGRCMQSDVLHRAEELSDDVLAAIERAAERYQGTKRKRSA
jgi:hypothetical protein